jgi:hypothetical protein
MSWPGRSLAPGRSRSRSVEEVVAHVADGSPAAAELTAALREIEAAAAAAFPGNIYWDTELLATELLRAGPGELAALGRQIAGLQALYGHNTVIRFRYVHDFLYGYDWAKWVQREPEERAGVGPFAPAFIDHQERRARELEQLIADDDAVYPSLPEGQVRNPFPFSREPEAEALLLAELAAAGLLPVEAWDAAASPRWDRPYADLRIERAAALGLSLPE